MGFLPCDPWHRHHMLSCLYVAIAVQWRRLILHSVLATKTCTDGQQHQAYKRIQVGKNSSEVLPNDICEISTLTKFS